MEIVNDMQHKVHYYRGVVLWKVWGRAQTKHL